MKLYDGQEIIDYLKDFSHLFVCHKTNNIVKCGQFISGLLHDCKSNIERMVERVSERDYDQLHHFISESPWDSLAIMASVAQKVQATLNHSSQSSATPSTMGLIIDESG